MKLLSDKSVFAIKKNGFLFYIEKFNDNKKRYFKFNKECHIEINKDEFYISIFGVGYNKMLNIIEDKEAVSIDFDNIGNIYTCFYQDSLIYMFDKKGTLIKVFEEMGKVDNIYDIAIDDNSIWCAYPTSHTVIKYSLITGEKQISISEGSCGEDSGSIFCYPESITKKNNHLYIADMGNKRVCSINNETNEVTEYLKFKVPVFGFDIIQNIKIVFLESSANIYILNE